MEMLVYLIIVVLVAWLLCYMLFDVHYFTRSLVTIIISKFFKSKAHILDELTVNGVVLTNDIDTYLSHMNNTRFLREIDFARLDFVMRTGLFGVINAKGGQLVQGACTIRYRRFISLYSTYKITSRIIYWDDKSIFMEHRFLNKENFVHAIVLARQRLINGNAEEVMATLMSQPIASKVDKAERGECSLTSKPQMPPELAKWLESNDISSEQLRAETSFAAVQAPR